MAKPRSFAHAFRQTAAIAVIGWSIMTSGCGGPAVGHVNGQVLFDGKPLPGGRVMFRPSDPAANAVSADLDDQGRFSVTLPCGDVQISVDNRELRPRVRVAPEVPVNLPPEVRAKLGDGSRSSPGMRRLRAATATWRFPPNTTMRNRRG